MVNLQKQKTSLTTNHNRVLAILNADLAILESQVPYPTNAVLIQKEKIDSENRSYSLQNQNLTNSIDQYKALITGIEKQDTKFANNIETVNGYISVSWVSLWQMAKILSPIHPSIVLIILILVLWKVLSLSRVVPKIELI